MTRYRAAVAFAWLVVLVPVAMAVLHFGFHLIPR